MNLSFQLYADKKKTVRTYFPQKILQGLFEKKLIDWTVYDQCMSDLILKLPVPYGWAEEEINPKVTTIREDMKWREGMNIHFIINNRQPTRFQFAPLLPVKKVQLIEIMYGKVGYKRAISLGDKFIYHQTSDGEEYKSARFKTLWKGEGFESEKAFWAWFKKPLKGVLIDWI